MNKPLLFVFSALFAASPAYAGDPFGGFKEFADSGLIVLVYCFMDTPTWNEELRVRTNLNLEIIRRNVDEIVLVDDAEMRAAARWLWFELGLAVELSAAAAIAALQTGRYLPPSGAQVTALICGAGTDGMG